jgi:outer membrane protein assembly factor BamB
MRRILVVCAVVAELLFGSAFNVSAAPAASVAPAAQQANWTSYLGGARHPSFTTNAQISKAAAANLKVAWSWKPDPPTMVGQAKGGFYSSPTVYNHRIYIGAYTGVFYALDETTGKVLWSRFLGFQPSRSCAQPLGFVSTATVMPVPNATNTGTVPAVYVAAPDGYMYSLDGVTGATRWRSLIAKPSTTVNDAFNWSSPTIVNGRIYLGFASNCDTPWIRGGVVSLDQNTGARLATWYGVPPGSIGGGVWTSAAVTSDGVFATTASTCGTHPDPASNCPPTNQLGNSYSFVRLDPITMKLKAAWLVPPAELKLAGDPDWSSSPVVFNATVNGTVTRLVGACHKNGFFYVLRTGNMTAPFWKRQIGSPTDDGGDGCLAGAIYDGTRLFLAGNATKIGGVDYQGSIRRVDPATGATVWEQGLTANVLGTPSENGAGVIAAATHDFKPVGLTNQTYLINSDNGAILATIPNGKEFAQPIFADKYLFLTGAYTNTLQAFVPGP